MSEQETFEGWAGAGAWRPVVGFEELYEVSSEGRVRRIGKAARTGKGRGGGARVGRTLRLQATRHGYLAVQLWRNGEHFMRLVHRLVAESFVSPIPDGIVVNHIDGVKTHNTPANLECVTSGENNQHAYRTGLRVVTAAQRVSKRRRARRSVPCACGCGAKIETPDSKGRERQYVTGHNMVRRTA